MQLTSPPPTFAFLKLPVVLNRMALSRSEFYRQVSAGFIPRPVSNSGVGTRNVAWPAHEIDAVTAARIAGLADDQMRALAAHLVEQRKTLAPTVPSAFTAAEGSTQEGGQAQHRDGQQ